MVIIFILLVTTKGNYSQPVINDRRTQEQSELGNFTMIQWYIWGFSLSIFLYFLDVTRMWLRFLWGGRGQNIFPWLNGQIMILKRLILIPPQVYLWSQIWEKVFNIWSKMHVNWHKLYRKHTTKIQENNGR